MKKIMFNDKYGLTQAVLDGRKTMTRRIATPATDRRIAFGNVNKEWYEDEEGKVYIPSYEIGEVIAISQNYKNVGYDGSYTFGASFPIKSLPGWSNKMFVKAEYMPYKIEITNVGMSLLQNISDDDCIKEGVYRLDSANGSGGIAYSFANASDKKHIGLYDTPREAFAALINKVSGGGTWERNSFVWVYEFKLFN